MSTYYWIGGAFLWTTPGVFIGPEILSGPSLGTFPVYPTPPGPGDILYLNSYPTLDNIAVTGVTIEVHSNGSVISDLLENSSFDGATTIDVSGEAFWTSSFFGSNTTAATINIGNAGTFGNASFLLGETSDITTLPTLANTGVINIVNGHIVMSDEVAGEFLNSGVINVEDAGPQVSSLLDDLSGGMYGFVNDGSLAINGEGATSDTLALGFFNAGIGGIGNISITDGKLSVQAVSSGQTIAFEDANGILILGSSDLSGDTFQASIEGFRPGDTIDLGTAASSIDPSELGEVIVDEGVNTVGTLELTAAPGNDIFALGQNTANGDGLLEMVAACYAAGARILTDAGEVAVERLRAGDRVVTLRGRMEPVRWIGHRHLDLRGHPRPWDAAPVRVRAHAFGAGRPHMDLLLSPDHAVFFDRMLIPVRHLLNGATVVQEHPDAVTYYHVELAGHAVLLAQGLAAESYLDTGNRGAFANGAAAVHMRPDFALAAWQATACAPLVWEGERLRAVRRLLRETAALLGHVPTDDPDLRLVVDGQEVRPETDGTLRRFQLPPSARRIRLVSRCAVPAQLRDDSDDHRRLGVAVVRVRHDGSEVPLADARLGSGWHGLERGEGGVPWRWTDGDAVLVLSAGGLLEIEVAMTERYWAEPADKSTDVA